MYSITKEGIGAGVKFSIRCQCYRKHTPLLWKRWPYSISIFHLR